MIAIWQRWGPVLSPVCVLQDMAVRICQTILKQRTLVGSMEKVEMLLDFISPLVKDTEGLEDDDDVSDPGHGLSLPPFPTLCLMCWR